MATPGTRKAEGQGRTTCAGGPPLGTRGAPRRPSTPDSTFRAAAVAVTTVSRPAGGGVTRSPKGTTRPSATAKDGSTGAWSRAQVAKRNGGGPPAPFAVALAGGHGWQIMAACTGAVPRQRPQGTTARHPLKACRLCRYTPRLSVKFRSVRCPSKCVPARGP